MKKRLFQALALLIVIVMAIGLTACAGSGGSGTPDAGSSSAPAGGGTSTSPAAPSNAGTSSAPPAPATSVAPPPAPDKITGDPVYFTWAHPFPALHHHNVQIVQPLADELFEKSNGLINITVEPGGTITTGTTAIDDVTTGAVDMMWTLPGYTPGRFPLLDCIEFPNHFNSSVEATKVLWQLFQQSEAFRNEFKDYKVFLMYSADMGEFWNNTRPIKTPADCAGLNLRTPGAMTERTMRALGLGAVNMPMPDVYDNIDRGVIQGLAVGPSAIPTYHLEEVVSYGTNGLNLFASPQMMCMSWDAWNKLSPDLQALFDSLTGEAFWIKAATIYDEMGATSRKGITGVEYYELTAADKAAFTTATAGVVDEYLAELNGKGYDGNAFYNLMISIRDGIR